MNQETIDENNLISFYKHHISSQMTTEEINYINAGHRQFTFVISQPLCGAEALMTMASIVGGCGIRGIRMMDFYSSMIQFNNSHQDHSVYGNVKNLHEDGISLLNYGCCKPEFEETKTSYYMRQLIMPSEGFSTMCIETHLGFGNNLLIPFIETLRNIFYGNRIPELKIIFLTDDLDRLIDRSHRFGHPSSKMDPSVVRDLYQNQKLQMQEASDLGDTWMKLDDLHNDPHACLMKCKPTIFPNRDSIKEMIQQFKK